MLFDHEEVLRMIELYIFSESEYISLASIFICVTSLDIDLAADEIFWLYKLLHI